MRIATWNIRAGGGQRIGPIAQVILESSPDVLVLTEFRHMAGRALLEGLREMAYNAAVAPVGADGQPDGPLNRVCVLSRHPVEALRAERSPKSLHRWVPVVVPSLDLTILGVHVPNQTEVWNKREFWSCVEDFAQEAVGKRSLILGDLNTALDEDCEGDPIREAVHMRRLLEAGWVDAWRAHNPGAREFSWYGHRGNGFRIDHCLVSPPLAGTLVGSSMRHDVRTDRLSDHSLLTVEFVP